MVGGYCMHYILGLTILFGKISAYYGMRALNLVVHRLADIMKQADPLGLFHIKAKFSSHYTAQEGNLQ